MGENRLTQGNVVPFTRSAAYWHRRALRNRDEHHMLDALELLRRATQLGPENARYQLDLAEIYYEMGAFDRSNAILFRLVRRDDPPGEALFGLACNFFAQQRLPAAQDALLRYIALQPQGEYAGESGQMLEAIAIAALEDARRRRSRADTLSRLGARAMEAERFLHAERWFARDVRLRPDRPESRVMLALACSCRGQHVAALVHLQGALDTGGMGARQMGVVALVLASAGQPSAARRTLRRALALAGDEQEKLYLALVAGELGQHKLAEELLRGLVRLMPFDEQLLHALAAATLMSGRRREAAAALWARILKLDPGNVIAAYWVRAAMAHADAEPGKQGGSLPGLSYLFQVPPHVAHAWGIALRAALAAEKPPDWHAPLAGLPLEKLLEWAMGYPDRAITRDALALAARLEQPIAEEFLRAQLVAPQLHDEEKHEVMRRLSRLGAKLPLEVLMDDELRRVRMIVSDITQRPPVKLKRALMRAVLRDGDGSKAERIMSVYLDLVRRRGHYPRVPRAEAWLEALGFIPARGLRRRKTSRGVVNYLRRKLREEIK